MSKPNVLLFGLGAIGSVYATLLTLSGEAAVHVVARSTYSQVKAHGLKLKSDKFGDQHVRFDGVYKDCEDAARSGKTFDYVLCANKAVIAPDAFSALIAPVVSPTTSIVILQNGVGAEAPLHVAFPSVTVISAVVWTGAKSLADADGTATFQQFNREGLTIGVDYRDGGAGREEDEARLATLTGWLEKAGGECTVTKDIQSERWIKVIWNCTWNSLTAATRLRTNHIFGSSETALPLCHALMEEVVAVARAKGLCIPDGTVERLIKQCTDVGGPGLPSSMMADNEAGRPMEVEVILGVPAKEGKRLGVPVPILTTLYTIVKALDWRNAHKEEAAV
ncbi:hypothetical protein Q5752_005850 [Cryptotrichosporon argae]